MQRKMKPICFGIAALAALTRTAAAADMAVPGYYPPPAPVYAPFYNWTCNAKIPYADQSIMWSKL